MRSRAKYRTSLDVLARAKEIAPHIVTKSGLMLGLGETENELFQAMDDLRASPACRCSPSASICARRRSICRS